MRKTRISLLIVIAMCLSLFPLSIFITNTNADTKTALPDYQAVDWQSGLAGNVPVPDLSAAAQESHSSSPRASVTPGGVGSQVYDWYLEQNGFDPYMTLRAERDYVQVYVANDLAFPDGDPRNDDPLNLEITDDMCNYLADDFNDIIYAKDSGYFGKTADRYGNDTAFEYYGYPDYYWNWINVSNGQKVILKIMNIVDENYYNYTYPSYVAGFFSPSYTGYYDRNMVHIDAWRWWQRLGEEGHQWFPDTHPELTVTRPNLYESTLAHEYQHNIHGDQLPGDMTYMNEASSLFAEVYCGYALDAGQIEWFLATPDNSLTQWGDQGGINILADYGASFLWALYLTDHYGLNFMGEYTQGGLIGAAGLNALLAPYCKTFNQVFHDWRIANLVHAKYGLYGYQLNEIQAINPKAVLDFNELQPLTIHQIEERQLSWKSASDYFGETKAGTTGEGDTQYPTGVYNVGAYGSDYIQFTNLNGLERFSIDGQDYVPTEGWTYDDAGMYWYSGADDLLNTLIATQVYVDPTDPTLTLTTYWDMEDYWDFGFVQVSMDGKWDSDWVSLSNANTTSLHDPSAIGTAVDNLPGLTSWSHDIVDITFDLSAYSGQTVYLGFRYVTDWATFYEGWYLFNVIVSGQEYLNSLEHVYPEVDFMVTIVHSFYGFTFTYDMYLNDVTEIGSVIMGSFSRNGVIVIVSPIMDLGSADYQFKLSRFYFCGGLRHYSHLYHC